MNQFEKQSVVIALKKMFDANGFFSVSDFRTILKIVGVTVSDSEMRPFEVLHCIHYKEMPREFRGQLAKEVLAVIARSPEATIDVEKIFADDEPADNILNLPQQKHPLRRLLGL